MFKLPFLDFKKKRTLEDNFLAIRFDPFKVQVVYFEVIDSPDGEDAQIQIVSAISRFIALDNFFAREDNEDYVIEALEDVLEEMREEYTNLPRRVLFGISSEHCIDLMSVVKLQNPTRQRFVEEQVKELLEQAHKNAFFRAQDLLVTQRGDMDSSLELIASAEISRKIDGAPTRDPVGLEGKELEISWFGSFAEDSHLRKLQFIAKRLGLSILTVSSMNYSLYSSLRDLNPKYRNCVLVNLDNAVTEVSVAFGNGLVGSRFINIGVISMLNQISSKLDLHYDEAQEVLEKYKQGNLDSSIAVEVQKVVRQFFVIWSQALSSIFSDFTGIKTFSSKVLVVGPGFDFPDLFELFSKEPWYKSIPFKAPPDFEKVFASDKLVKISDLSGGASLLSWTLPLSLSNIYYKIQEEQK